MTTTIIETIDRMMAELADLRLQVLEMERELVVVKEEEEEEVAKKETNNNKKYFAPKLQIMPMK